MVFHDRISSVYSSLEACNAQVTGFKNSGHKGFKTRHATKDAYFTAVLMQACNNFEVGKVDSRFGLKNSIISICQLDESACGLIRRRVLRIWDQQG